MAMEFLSLRATMPIAAGEMWETSPTTGATGRPSWFLVPIIEGTGMGAVGYCARSRNFILYMDASDGDDANSGGGGVGDVADDGDDGGKRSRRAYVAYSYYRWGAGAGAAGRDGYCAQVELATARDIEQYGYIKNVMQTSDGLAKLGQC